MERDGTPMTYYVLYNPHAGNGRGKEAACRLAELLAGNEVKFQDMTRVEDYGALLDTLPAEETLVLAGGDGTLNRFLNEVPDIARRRKVLYYATGSGNDFLTDIGGKKDDAPRDITRYLEHLPSVCVKGKTGFFLNGIGYGIDGYCCQEGDRLRATSSKPINYTSIAIKGLLFHYKPASARVTVDGVTHTYDHVWLAPAMYGRFYGGGMMPPPEQDRLASPEKLSVMVYHCPSKLKALAVFPSIFKGEHVKKTGIVEILTGQNIHVEFDRPTPLQIDGETVPDVTSYRALACSMVSAER